MAPRKHADLIKAWADGAEIQRYCGVGLKWRWADGPAWSDDPNPAWSDDEIYRIKPVPKADYTKAAGLFFANEVTHGAIRVSVTFDGETGEAKKVEIIK